MAVSEGGMEAPKRNKLNWKNKDFNDLESLDNETRRVFDICHGCRRCFNLCDSFPKLFDMIDESETGELDSVESNKFEVVAESCTLCDMCYMTKCPYVPPHEFNLDFPHLMLRYKSTILKNKKTLNMFERMLLNTDLTGKLGNLVPGITNFILSKNNFIFRKLLNKFFKIHLDAVLPSFKKLKISNYQINNKIKNNYSDKVVVYTTCYVNYNMPNIAKATLEVLKKNNEEVQFIYPECCGMPYLENGDLDNVAKKAAKISKVFESWIDKGYKVVTLTPSCGLMMKSEWPLILPENESVIKLSKATKDICEYLVNKAKNNSLNTEMAPINEKVSLHFACHSRAQNMGPKAAEMLKLIPELELNIVERCSGHGGTFGVKNKTFDIAKNYVRGTIKKIEREKPNLVLSECPLAHKHINKKSDLTIRNKYEISHPIELLAQSYKKAR